MSSGICLYGVDCTERAIFEKHLIRIICCPCRGAPNAVFSSIVMDFFESVETDPTGEKTELSWGKMTILL